MLIITCFGREGGAHPAVFIKMDISAEPFFSFRLPSLIFVFAIFSGGPGGSSLYLRGGGDLVLLWAEPSLNSLQFMNLKFF